MRAMERRPLRSALAAAAITALLAAPGHAAAQDPIGEPTERERDRERCICFDGTGDDVARHFSFRTGRGRLGLLLGEAETVGDRTGVRVEDVVEGGPADRAGMAAGDVVVALDEEPLGSDPARDLVDRLRDAEPGDTVTVRFRRDGREQTARAVLDDRGPFAFRFDPDRLRIRTPDGRVGAALRGFPAEAPRMLALERFFSEPLQLVALNPGLGRYFGVEDGVLVVDVEDGTALGIQPGDVLLAIDGRELEDPRHARSILASYRPDEEIETRLVRDRRTITVRGTRGARGP